MVAALVGAPIARSASAQACEGGIFAIPAVAPGGASVRMTRSAPAFFAGAGWTLETCFVLAQHGSVTEPVSATLAVAIDAQPNVFYPLANATLRPVGGLPAQCQILPDGHHLALVSPGPLPPLSISEECCVLVVPPTTPTCEELPGEPDALHVELDTPSQPVYLVSIAVLDRDRTIVSGGGGGSSGGGCGLTGIEFLGVPFALLALRARSGRRAGGGS
jgi:hypothetical protein